MRRVSIGRIVALILAVGFLGVAGWCGVEAWFWGSSFYEWLEARPTEMMVDLSQSGTTTAAFHQTCSIAHGEVIYLECELSVESGEGIAELFDGLSGSLAIVDQTGTEVERFEIDSSTVWMGDRELMLVRFKPFPTGDYTMSLQIDSGAASLAGNPVKMFARYQLCGLEQAPAVINGVIAFVAGFIGIVLLAWVMPALLQEGIWGRAEVANPTTDSQA